MAKFIPTKLFLIAASGELALKCFFSTNFALFKCITSDNILHENTARYKSILKDVAQVKFCPMNLLIDSCPERP